MVELPYYVIPVLLTSVGFHCHGASLLFVYFELIIYYLRRFYEISEGDVIISGVFRMESTLTVY